MEDLLSPYGKVQAPLRVSSETRQIDVWFVPHVPPKDLQPLGLLGRLAQTTTMLEPFRNAADIEEICTCLLKALEVRGELHREARRNKTKLPLSSLPLLWILTPTASKTLRAGFGASPQTEKDWPSGIYFLPKNLKTAIVAIHQLPKTPETLWLRLLGRGGVQKQAIDELEALSVINPFRNKALELVLSLQRDLEADRDKDDDDRELIMRLSTLYLQDKEQTLQQGIQQGIQQGAQQDRQTIVENLLIRRFGSIDPELATIVDPIVALVAEEFAALLLQFASLSREELLTRFQS